MQITVWPDNRITFTVDPDDNDVRVITLIRLFQETNTNPLRLGSRTLTPRVKPVGTLDFEKNPGGRHKTAPELGPLFYDVWSYLVSHDRPAGVEISAIVEAIGITYYAAGYRLGQLAKRGYADRVTRGHYRATTPTSQENAASRVEQEA